MCGIALILSGIRINLSSLFPNTAIQSPVLEVDQHLFSIDDIKAALQRRGPDSLGCKYIFLNTDGSSDFERGTMLSSVEVEDLTKRSVEHCGQICECIAKTDGVSHRTNNTLLGNKFFGQCSLVGATLQLRGVYRITQPLVDTCGNILVYNGEIFGGIHVSTDSNDAEVLMQSLRNCCNCISHEPGRECPCNRNGKTSVPELLSTIKGPWALIYWQESSRTIWFGRDALGRRSLLVHWPSSKDPRLLLSSVSPYTSIYESSDSGDGDGGREITFWDELPCAVYSLSLGTSERDGYLTGEVRKHNWTDPMLEELVKWERTSVEPNHEKLNVSHEKLHGEQSMLLASLSNISPEIEHKQASILVPPSHAVLVALRESVRRRTELSMSHQRSTHGCIREDNSPVAVLFSGGLDSMILAALLDECLDAKYEIDLVNVSFDGESAPDRISARAGLKELRRISSFRRWKLIEIDADLSKLALETKHVMSLIDPAKTYMDLNIGMALWLAAGGNGWLNEETGGREDQRIKYESKSRVLLVGSGADEQCAGYGRYKTKYRQSSWIGLHEEMKLDMQRIWKRNLGRDDRCIADSGKEARFPFLDEDMIRTLLNIPLWEIADLDQPSGIGDKKILRDVARILGLHEAAVLPKRAIQFGSRIARESNKKNFGSNRAANQASAGSAVICMSSNSS